LVIDFGSREAVDEITEAVGSPFRGNTSYPCSIKSPNEASVRSSPRRQTAASFARGRYRPVQTREETPVTTVIAVHAIEDSEHWLASPKREELFGPLGISVRTFLDPENPTRAAVMLEVPDMAAFQAFMRSDAATAAMEHDGVQADTLEMFVQT
jgi:hypothetical protein